MATFNWPSGLVPSTMTVSLVSNTQANRSKWSGVVQTVRVPGSRWRIDLTFNNLDDSESRLLEGLLFRLDGQANRVKCRDFGRLGDNPKGTPRVSVGDQQGDQVTTSGWNANTTVLKVGDWVVIGGELKMVTVDCGSNASGIAIIQFTPALRRSPAVNSSIDTLNTWSTFLLSENTAGVDRKPAFNNDITITLEEDIV